MRQVYPVTGIEQTVNPGSIFQPSNMSAMLLIQDDSKPHRIGDTLKIDIAENLSASSKITTESSRKNNVATKGPGGANTMSSLLNSIINADASASGSDSFDGKGKTDNTNVLKGKLAASVVNVLPNGNLEVAGEKKIAFNGTINTLRFSGVVDPKDIKSGRIVSSEDVVDARLEQTGDGMIAEAGSRGWLQKFLTDTLIIW